MTQAPKEYIITEDEMKEYCRLKAEDGSGSFTLLSKVHALATKYEDEFRSRPHPAPAQGWIRESFVTLYSNKLFTVGEVCNLIEGHRSEAAKAEREQVLDEMLKELQDNEQIYFSSCHDDGDRGCIQGIQIAISITKSLRQREEEVERG